MKKTVLAGVLALAFAAFFYAWQAGVLGLMLAAVVYGFDFGGPRDTTRHEPPDGHIRQDRAEED